MISNQILQNTIDGLKGISRVDFCVLDTEGKELAATFDHVQDCGRGTEGRCVRMLGLCELRQNDFLQESVYMTLSIAILTEYALKLGAY